MVLYFLAAAILIWLVTLLYFWFRPRCHVDSSTTSRWFFATMLALIAAGFAALGL